MMIHFGRRLLISLLALQAACLTASPTMTKEEAIRLAREALRAQVGAESEIQVRSAEPIEWPDAGLGCPQDGAVHDPVATPGYRLVLRVERRLYRVHAGAGRAVVCDRLLEQAGGLTPGAAIHVTPEAPPPSRPPATPALRKLVEQARVDLAKRLSIDPEHVDFAELETVTWGDSSLGCPQPGMSYLQVLSEGYIVRLRIEKRVYQYHAKVGGRPFLCQKPSKRPLPGPTRQ